MTYNPILNHQLFVIRKSFFRFLLVATTLCISFASAQTSYNLPLEITDIALNSRMSRDSGTDAYEIASSYSTTGRSGASSLASGYVTNNGLDIAIHIGWYPSAFGNESILMRLFFLQPSPLVYSPDGIQLDSRFNTKILSLKDSDYDGTIDEVKILRTNGTMLVYKLEEGSTVRFLPSENQISYPTHLEKVAENEYHRIDQLGNRIIYKLNNIEDAQDDEVWYRSYLGNTVTESSSGIDVEVIHRDGDETAYIRQIRTAQTLVDIDDSALLEEHYAINFYKIADVGAKDSNGYYTTSPETQPYATWIVANPEPESTRYSKVRILKIVNHDTDSDIYVYDYEYNQGDGWILQKADGEKTETLSKYPDVDSDGIFHEWVVSDSSGNSLRNYSELVTSFQWGSAVTERTIRTGGADGEVLTQKLDYFTDPNELNSYGKPKSIENPDGSWLKFEYDSEGRLLFQSSPWEDSTIDNASSIVQTQYDYTPLPDDTATELEGIARTVTTRVQGVVTDRIYNSYQTDNDEEVVHIVEKAHSTQASYGDSLNERVVTTYYGTGSSIPEIKRSQKKSVLYPSGRMDSFDYSEDENDHIYTTVIQGTAQNPGGIPYKTTKSVVETDEKGNQISIKVYICTGSETYSSEAITEVTHEYDDLNNLVRTYKNGRLVYEADYEGTHLVKVVGEDGTTFEYDYDSLERLTEVIRWGAEAYGDYPSQASVATITEFNAADQKVSQTIGALKTDGSLDLSLSVQYEYDDAGRVTKMINPGFLPSAGDHENDFVTTVEYSEGGREVKTTNSDGTESIIRRRIDGAVSEKTGCCIVDKFYDFFVNESGFRVSQKSVVSRNSPRWSKSVTDMLGRTLEQEQPAFGGDGVVKQEFVYDENGFLVKSIAPGRGDVLYEYDELGRMNRQGLDVDGNGVLDSGGDDVISEGNSYFEFDSVNNAWYTVSESKTYATTGSARKTTLGVSRTRISNFVEDATYGTLAGESISEDMHGNKSTSRIYVDRTDRIVTKIAEIPQSDKDPRSVFYNGKLMEAYGSLHDQPTRYYYDALGRRVTIIAPTGQKTVLGESIYKKKMTVYRSNGYLLWEIIQTGTLDGQGDFVELPDAHEDTLTYDYYMPGESHPGFLKSITHDFEGTTPSQTRYWAYTDKGQLWRTWGDVTIPVEKSYDEYGQLVSFRTFRNSASIDWSTDDVYTPQAVTSGGDQTTFVFDEATGLTTARLDALDHQQSYDYSAWGGMEKFTNARGQVAEFDYDPVKSNLRGVSFDDGITSAVQYEYDRLGRINEVADGVYDYEIGYNEDTLQLEFMRMEGLNGMGLDKTMTAQYETATEGIAGRPSGWNLSDTATSTSELFVQYGYDNKGRLESIRSSHTAGGNDRYFYEYSPDSNFLASIQYQLPSQNTETVASFTYSPDKAQVNSRTNAVDGDTTTPGDAVVMSRYDYTHNKDLGMIETTIYQGQAYQGAEYFTKYSYNDQYQLSDAQNYHGTDIENDDASNKVTDENWSYTYDYMGNRLTSLEGSLSRDYTSNALNQIVPATGQGNLAYDGDGNLVSDDYWEYTWDALNRLIEMVPTYEGRTLGYKKHVFTYDYMSRRVRKKVYDWETTGWMLYPTIDEKYVYNGWHLIAVYDGNTSNALLRTYTWGMDGSGSVGGAGGIGGLISVEEHSGTYAGKKFLYLYDAIGNVSQLIDSEDGSIVARYQYDPYGKTRVSAGNGYQDVNPFRYQTKFTDNDTGLIYYGYRYYSYGLGRFLNRDPLGEQGGINLYAFVGNDPVNGREFLGLSKLSDSTPDDYHWWREGLGASDDGNSNWRKILTHAYLIYAKNRDTYYWHDFQTSTLAAYSSVENKADEAELDRVVGQAVDDAVKRLVATNKSKISKVTLTGDFSRQYETRTLPNFLSTMKDSMDRSPYTASLSASERKNQEDSHDDSPYNYNIVDLPPYVVTAGREGSWQNERGLYDVRTRVDTSWFHENNSPGNSYDPNRYETEEEQQQEEGPEDKCYKLVAVDPNSGEETDVLKADGSLTPVPADFDVQALTNAGYNAVNVDLDLGSYPVYTMLWFYQINGDGGPMDPKRTAGSIEFQHVGNFAYGTVGYAAGIPLVLLDKQAGYRQSGSLPEWGDKPFLGVFGGTPPNYGNEPADTHMTHMGYEMARSGKTFEKREVPCDEVGL